MADDKALRVRSPNYPAIGLGAAIEASAKIFKKIHTHAAPRDVVLAAMGYKTYNGASASALSAVVKYGFILKIGADYKLTDRAMSIEHPRSDREKAEAIKEALYAPTLWADLLNQFGGHLPDDSLVRATLLRKGFGASAVAPIIHALRDSVELADRFVAEYGPSPSQDGDEEGEDMEHAEAINAAPAVTPAPYRVGDNMFDPRPPKGTRREVITLDEGDVVITFPEGLSAASVDDLKDHLELFIRKTQRRSVEKKDEAAH